SKTMPVGTPLSGKDRLLIKQWIEGLPAPTTSGPVQNLTLLSPQNNQIFSLDQISINGKCDGAESVLVSGDIIGNVQTACYNNTFVTSARLTPGNGVKNLVLSQINSAG